ncbi:DUF4411 family protein [Staphylococcus sp. FSL W8-1268]|uniref:DUF4411 family protein n=1 Tax=Staphylococcus TaxID=1279 RepID=UPI000D1E0140|nr:DUF4411 family protein [Staphylococcus hominis]PTK31594.1 hypothetical protein BUZ47_08155 [Staphylococcus hominis]
MDSSTLNQTNNIFLIDSNCLIAPSKNYYSFILTPSFWKKINNFSKKGLIKTIDKVKNEICHQTNQSKKDELQKWFENSNVNNVINVKSKEDIVANYQKILNYIQSQSCYQEIALKKWSDQNVADPWLIATAMTFNYTIVTFEMDRNKMQLNNQLNEAKIPEICKAFGVNYCNLFEMLEKLNFQL